MRKLFNRRPSAGAIIGFMALVVALGGGAYAAKKKTTTTKIEYKGLSKDARLKVLPLGATNAGSNCDPTSQNFTTCTSVTLNGSTAFKRRVALTFDGVFDSATTTPARGECRLQLDGTALNGASIHVQPTHHVDPTTPVNSSDKDYGDGYGINIITTAQGGEHTYSVACNEISPSGTDLKVRQFQLSAIQAR